MKSNSLSSGSGGWLSVGFMAMLSFLAWAGVLFDFSPFQVNNTNQFKAQNQFFIDDFNRWTIDYGEQLRDRLRDMQRYEDGRWHNDQELD